MPFTDPANLIKYRFSVPLMNTKERAQVITDELDKLFNLGYSYSYFEGLENKICCDYVNHIVEIELYESDLFSPTSIINTIEAVKISSFYPACFIATQIVEPSSSSYLPMARSMMTPTTYPHSASDRSNSGCSDEENSSCSRSGSDIDRESKKKKRV